MYLLVCHSLLRAPFADSPVLSSSHSSSRATSLSHNSICEPGRCISHRAQTQIGVNLGGSPGGNWRENLEDNSGGSSDRSITYSSFEGAFSAKCRASTHFRAFVSTNVQEMFGRAEFVSSCDSDAFVTFGPAASFYAFRSAFRC